MLNRSTHRESPRIYRARDYLAAYFDQRLPLHDLASVAGLSPFHLQRVFAKTFGETPHEFAVRLRINRAKELLLADNHTITEICFALGYQSLGSFSGRFRQTTGISPSQFRKEARRMFAGSPDAWKLYYIPACFKHFFL